MITTADVFDEHGDRLESLSLQLRDLGGVVAFHGAARTVRCFRDNGLVKAVLATPGEGCVLVIDGGGSLESALIGDLLAATAVANEWAGIIVNGAIRDRAVLETLPIGVKARGSNPRRSAKVGEGELDVPVTFGGVCFRPGAQVWADADGVVVER